MRRLTGLLLVAALTLSLLIPNFSFAGQNSAPRTWVVDSTGIDADFRTISSAIYTAASGDTIYVKAGTYAGGFSIGKSITLIGENPQITVIDSGNDGLIWSAVLISASNVSISGFAFTGYPQYFFSIQSGSHITIEGNIIQPYIHGYSPYYTPIAIGLITDGSYNRICRNNMSNVAEGVLAVGAGSNNVFSDNNIFASTAGFIVQADNVAQASKGYLHNYTIANNTIFGGGAYGIAFFNGYNSTLSGNVVGGNYSETLFLGDTFNNTVCHNIFETSSTNSLLTLSNSTLDLFYGNCFLNSSSTYCATLVLDDWDNGYPVGGNYWRDYTGVDRYSGANQRINGSDGIGDTPYEAAEEIVDYYPLMKPPMEFVYQAASSWQLPQLPMPTPIPTPKLTPMPTPTPTSIPTPKATPTPTPKPTPIPTPNPTPSPTPPPTNTPIPSDSPVPTQPPSPTVTPKPSVKATATPTPTVTSKPAATVPPASANPTPTEYPDSVESPWYQYVAIGALGMLGVILLVMLALKNYSRKKS
jgi:parallel beta-helix repeat protein